MALSNEIRDICTRLLHEELRVAMGCTEPISLAYAAAYARHTLGAKPQRYEAHCSGNIIKNVKAVTVPNTGGRKGIAAAVLAGGVSGRQDLELEVLSSLTDEDRQEIDAALEANIVQIRLLESDHPLHIILHAWHGEDHASVEIVDSHIGLGKVTRNGEVLHSVDVVQPAEDLADRQKLTVRYILDYANQVDLAEVRELLERQIKYNSAISQDGLESPWGACVGQTVAADGRAGSYARIKAAAAAGSDARMNGCALPVVINSGSGNQGMTVSLPVIQYAADIGAEHEKLLRALCLSNLLAIHQKTGIGKLSAFCGVVCAATGAVCGIAWLDGADYQTIADTITNSLSNVGGMVCDGAKSSCAAKIVSALESALLGYEMARQGRVFEVGEGLVKGDVEATIASIARMAALGMRETDTEILRIMIGQ